MTTKAITLTDPVIDESYTFSGTLLKKTLAGSVYQTDTGDMVFQGHEGQVKEWPKYYIEHMLIARLPMNRDTDGDEKEMNAYYDREFVRDYMTLTDIADLVPEAKQAISDPDVESYWYELLRRKMRRKSK